MTRLINNRINPTMNERKIIKEKQVIFIRFQFIYQQKKRHYTLKGKAGNIVGLNSERIIINKGKKMKIKT